MDSSLLELVSVQLIVKEITVEIDIGTAIGLDTNKMLPSICGHKHTCQVRHEAYVLMHPEQNCPLSIICHKEFNQVPIIQDGKQHKEPIRIQAETHLVLLPKEIKTVICNSTYAPIFVAADEPTLHHLVQNYLHL